MVVFEAARYYRNKALAHLLLRGQVTARKTAARLFFFDKPLERLQFSRQFSFRKISSPTC